VNVVQAARADLEKVVTALNGQGAVYVENMASLLRAVAKGLCASPFASLRAALSGVLQRFALQSGRRVKVASYEKCRVRRVVFTSLIFPKCRSLSDLSKTV
jgi:hypothetical protein